MAFVNQCPRNTIDIRVSNIGPGTNTDKSATYNQDIFPKSIHNTFAPFLSTVDRNLGLSPKKSHQQLLQALYSSADNNITQKDNDGSKLTHILTSKQNSFFLSKIHRFKEAVDLSPGPGYYETLNCQDAKRNAIDRKPLQAKVLLERIIKTSRKHYPSIPNCRFGYLMDQNRNLKPIDKQNAKILPADGSIQPNSTVTHHYHHKHTIKTDSVIRRVRDVVKSINQKGSMQMITENQSIIKRNEVSPKHLSEMNKDCGAQERMKFELNDNPGPGYYEIYRKTKSTNEKYQFFGSTSIRFDKIQNLTSSIDSSPKHSIFQAHSFNSKETFSKDKRQLFKNNKIPVGPGSYELSGNQYFRKTLSAFVTKQTRFKVRQQKIPAPGAYNHEENGCLTPKKNNMHHAKPKGIFPITRECPSLLVSSNMKQKDSKQQQDKIGNPKHRSPKILKTYMKRQNRKYKIQNDLKNLKENIIKTSLVGSNNLNQADDISGRVGRCLKQLIKNAEKKIGSQLDGLGGQGDCRNASLKINADVGLQKRSFNKKYEKQTALYN